MIADGVSTTKTTDALSQTIAGPFNGLRITDSITAVGVKWATIVRHPIRAEEGDGWSQ